MSSSLLSVEPCRQRIVDDRSSARLRCRMAREEDGNAAERQALGARLKAERLEAGYTLRSAAEALTKRGNLIGFQAIGAWEDGRNVPSALWIERVARLYGVSVDLFFLNDRPALPFSRELLLQINSLESEGLTRIENVMRAHLGMPPIPAQELESSQAQQQTDTSTSDKTDRPVKNARRLSTQVDLGGNRASGEVERVQKSRSGRGN